ncbi:MAG: protein kinase, partial [Verrucomicrobia bacterium]|nr:protein kinase [Verrucomicrobiota bacterium]
VHRDIKPANLMVVRDDDESGDDAYAELRVKVIDFGLARSLFAATHVDGSVTPASDPGALTNVTVAGFVGTPLFASPEQLEEKDLDARSDFYSLGVTLWYLLAGQPPFTGTLASIISQHLTREPPLENLPATVPAPVRELLARLLQKDRAARPQTAVELRNELEAALRATFAARAASVVANEAAETLPEGDALFAVAAADLPSAGSARRGDADGSSFASGTMLGGRFRLVRYVGEGSGGRLFLARDLMKDRAPVAVRVLPADLVVTPQEEDALRADCERARQAPHPALLGAYACERHGLHFCLVREWISGFTLVDLLRNRGTLGVEDVLRLLQPTALGVDHAADAGLSRRLDLAPHQVFLHFPGDRVNDGADAPLRSVPDGPLAGWPAWQLKLDPLGISRESADLVTWAGDLTLLPENDAAVPAVMDAADGHRLAALGRLVYELLGGVMAADGPVRFVNRPSLGEEANDVLRRCVQAAASDADAAFASSVDFYEALARASGYDPATLEPFVAPPPVAPASAAAALSISSPPAVPVAAEEEQANTRGAFDTLSSPVALPPPQVGNSNPPQKIRTPARRLRPAAAAGAMVETPRQNGNDRVASPPLPPPIITARGNGLERFESSAASAPRRSDESAEASAWQRALLLSSGDDGGSFFFRWPVVMLASVILLACAIAFAVSVQRRQPRPAAPAVAATA